jgi:ribosomal protein S18 acetylase RimI-like enzyme
MISAADETISIRTWEPGDAAACKILYREGLIGGTIAVGDEGRDIDDVDASYLREPGNCFWVAQNASGEVVGMIGVQHHEKGVGEIRRLRVRKDSRRRGIGSRLLEAAINFCAENGHLKITLDTFMERAPAIKLFEKFHFRHNRTRQVNGKELLYFYLDIYGQNRKST